MKADLKYQSKEGGRRGLRSRPRSKPPWPEKQRVEVRQEVAVARRCGTPWTSTTDGKGKGADEHHERAATSAKGRAADGGPSPLPAHASLLHCSPCHGSGQGGAGGGATASRIPARALAERGKMRGVGERGRQDAGRGLHGEHRLRLGGGAGPG